MLCYVFFSDGRARYVRELPGEEGADWGWTDCADKARPLSAYWRTRFRADQIFCGRTPHFLEC